MIPMDLPGRFRGLALGTCADPGAVCTLFLGDQIFLGLAMGVLVGFQAVLQLLFCPSVESFFQVGRVCQHPTVRGRTSYDSHCYARGSVASPPPRRTLTSVCPSSGLAMDICYQVALSSLVALASIRA